jgi:hypothetical protein
MRRSWVQHSLTCASVYQMLGEDSVLPHNLLGLSLFFILVRPTVCLAHNSSSVLSYQ